MDEPTQKSFYDDDLQVGGITSNVLGKLKEERQFAFKTSGEQLRVGASQSITVPVYDERICQLETPQVTEDHRTLSMSNPPAQDRRSMTHAGLSAEMLLIEQWTDPRELPVKCVSRSPPPVACSNESFKDSKDYAGKKSVAMQHEFYFDWNVRGKFEHDLINKVPVVWPPIGIKSPAVGSKSTHRPTMPFLAMVEEAHLLPKEQIEQIKSQFHNEHSDQNPRVLKRRNPVHERICLRAEKFGKMDLDDDIGNFTEDLELFSQEGTNSDCGLGPRIGLDQEVPIQHEDGNSKEETLGIPDGQLPRNTFMKVSSFNEGPLLNSKKSRLTWQNSKADRFLIEKTPHYEEQNAVVSCSDSLRPKLAKQSCFPGSDEKGSKGAILSGCTEAEVSSTCSKFQCAQPCLTADHSAGNSEPAEKEHVFNIVNDDSTHVQLYKAANSSRHEFNYYDRGQYPPLAQRVSIDMCSSLRAIGENDLITNVSFDDMDISTVQLGKDLMKGEMQVLHERKEVCDWMSRETIVSQDRLLKGFERFSPISPEHSFNHGTLLNSERFEKVSLDDFSDNSLDTQSVSLTEKALSQTDKVCESNPEKHLITGVPVDSQETDRPQAICDQTRIEKMETEEVADHQERGIMKNYPCKVNVNQTTAASAPNGEQEMANLRTDDQHPLMESKENVDEFNYGHQEDQPLKAASGEMKDEKESDHFRAEIERGMLELGGPEQLHFAMIFVKGALEKSQIVPSCNGEFKSEKRRKNMHKTTPAFSWKNDVLYHNQQAKASEPTENYTLITGQGDNEFQENGDCMEIDFKEGTPFLVKPLPKASNNRPLRLGLSRRHRSKSLHPCFRRTLNENLTDMESHHSD